MAKKPQDETPAKATLTDMLEALNAAFETAESKTAALQAAHQTQAVAVSEATAAFAAVKARQDSLVQAAAADADAARQALDKLRAEVNTRIGTLTGVPSDPRVSVK